MRDSFSPFAFFNTSDGATFSLSTNSDCEGDICNPIIGKILKALKGMLGLAQIDPVEFVSEFQKETCNGALTEGGGTRSPALIGDRISINANITELTEILKQVSDEISQACARKFTETERIEAIVIFSIVGFFLLSYCACKTGCFGTLCDLVGQGFSAVGDCCNAMSRLGSRARSSLTTCFNSVSTLFQSRASVRDHELLEKLTGRGASSDGSELGL